MSFNLSMQATTDTSGFCAVPLSWWQESAVYLQLMQQGNIDESSQYMFSLDIQVA